MGEWIFQSKGKPVLVLGVQCHNSSAYDAAEMETAWQVLEQMNGNTMEVPVYWDKIEPEEGRFDFSIVGDLLDQARARGKYLIFLWFATWKNGSMKYCPLWVKHDQERFHRVINQDGTALPLLSPHCACNRNADAKAFRELMKYIGKADSEHHTVLAVQVENEPGYAARAVCDYGPDGREAAAGALEMQRKLRNYEAVVSFDSNPAADLGRIRSRRVGWFNKKWEGKAPRGRGILIECEDGTLYLAGAGIRLSLRRSHDEGVPYSPIVEERHVNYDLVWEGTLSSDCTFVRRRIRSGDETDNAIFATPDSGVIKIVLGD